MKWEVKGRDFLLSCQKWVPHTNWQTGTLSPSESRKWHALTRVKKEIGISSVIEYNFFFNSDLNWGLGWSSLLLFSLTSSTHLCIYVVNVFDSEKIAVFLRVLLQRISRILSVYSFKTLCWFLVLEFWSLLRLLSFISLIIISTL